MTYSTPVRVATLIGFIMICGGSSATAQERRVPAPRVGYEQPQIGSLQGDTAVFVWARPVSGGHDLLLARREADGALGPARMLNRDPGSVRLLGIDEARPAVATDGDRLVAAAWFDRDGRLWATRSADGGRTFGAPVRVDGGPGHAAHAFVHADFDDDGVLHVVWLDARDAPEDLEEPAQVFHVAVTPEGATAEADLTGDVFASVCGCCRPYVHADRFGVKVHFRAIDAQGFRDVHRTERGQHGDWTPPVRIGPPLWKIAACPMSGPVADSGTVIWRDGSQPTDRVVEGWAASSPVRAILRPDDRDHSMGSPRWVGAADGDLLLVPGDPTGWLLRRDGGRWAILTDELPLWCTDALRFRDQILLVGDDRGRLQLEAYDLDR